ncbi:hypothetical protein LOC67_15020 [Stieleria sp. JC731]|uniref:hypothetical protein n=1 Tax=Pirellulaceae TaxID=2691357 RepID=UPI001E349DE4|nr:hypothetical protein [Stieleria sp. JC731]MCC9601871.1 hypothetical protein [Stieleria sp. JC731]
MLLFSVQDANIASGETWELTRPNGASCENIVEATVDALAAPVDFPALAAAIVPGDRVAFAVDPNIPFIDQVVKGAIDAVRKTEAGEIDIVLWDEATDETVELVKQVATGCSVYRHQCDSRAELSYLAADAEADPIYLSRYLVEADFVLPIMAIRPCEPGADVDVTGIFPTLTDSATRQRATEQSLQKSAHRKMPTGNVINKEVPWLLGVQLVCGVVVNDAGNLGAVVAGTIEAMVEQQPPQAAPARASLVIASLDGNDQQQSWENILRAIRGAELQADDDATIVVWTELCHPPEGAMLAIDDDQFEETVSPIGDEADGLPAWDRSYSHAIALRPMLQDYRILLHSQLAQDDVERLGLGVVESLAELANLSRGFASCCVVRAAGYAGNL